MDEATKRRWDVWLGLIAPPLTVLGIIIGVWQFLHGQEEQVRLENQLLSRQSTIEFQRQLWLEQLSVYRDVSKAVGKIAAQYDHPEQLDELLRDFLTLYWGTMIFVEDDVVERAMIEFYHEVRDYASGWSSTTRLKRKANDLIAALRASSERSWQQLDDDDASDVSK